MVSITPSAYNKNGDLAIQIRNASTDHIQTLESILLTSLMYVTKRMEILKLLNFTYTMLISTIYFGRTGQIRTSILPVNVSNHDQFGHLLHIK